MSNQDSDFGAFIAGFTIGGLVGAAIALLMAPQSGEETRTIIRDKSIELKDKVAETAEEALARAEAAAAEARARAESAAAEARKRAEEYAQKAREQAEELKQRGQVVLEEQKSRLEEYIESGKESASQRFSKESDDSEVDQEPPAEAAAEA